ncbi:probable cytochrome P450 313a4 isoform X1 [Drosophila sulfurigaster albostrigata]|uniref:probable cytochrome P450 313a4 isoform X1 n=1 Tax=Drosophila sulfurigaster albostrigata TaxID=89887 RepID=UPI002D21D62D|nr:probable cytochrome P450 313a4 isoform X1 [Drosophila sulfurigaster albostrigata]
MFGVQILIDIFHLHRDKKVWGENAETFDPEHFLPHNLQEKHPYSFIPFTKGIRNCIGWRHAEISIKITLAKLLRAYKFSTSFKFEDLDFIEDITLKFKTVPLLDIQRRDYVLPVLKHYLDKYGSFVLSWLGPMPFLIVADPLLTQDVLNSPHCVNKGSFYKVVEEAAGLGLFSMKEPHWSAYRKLFNPAFSHKMILSFIPIFNSEAAFLLKTVDKSVDCGGQNLKSLMEGFSLSIASQTIMGGDVKYFEHIRSNNLIKAFHGIVKSITDMGLSPWLISETMRKLLGKEEQFSKAKSQISGFLVKFIDSKLTKGSKAPEDDILINLGIDMMNRGMLTKEDLQSQLGIILFAAFETSANTVVYTLMLLAMFPEYQEKAFQELLSLFPNPGDFDVTYADTQNMGYMDLILNESMRLLAPVPIVARQTMQDVRLSNGIVIPKGVQIGIDIFHLHRDKKIWGENAEAFNPENFLPHNMQDKHPYSFIPFTKGIRNCIGWRYALVSIKLTLAKLLRNYKFSTNFKFEDLDFIENLTLGLKTVPLLEIQRRDC